MVFELLPYSIVLTVHITAFVINFTLVVLADWQGLLWVLGKKSVLSEKWLKTLHYGVWCGLSLSIITGVILFSANSAYLVTVPAFYTKLVLVLALLINSFYISRHLQITFVQSYKSLTRSERKSFVYSAIVSTVGWVGVVAAAKFLGL